MTRRLVVLVGPIASGKSTIAAALADRVDDACAVVDLDDVYFAQRPPPRSWKPAREVHAALVRAWFDAGVGTVIAHGPLGDAEEWAELAAAVPDDVDVRRVLLRTTFDIALERVRADETRVFSRNEDFLRHTYDVFATQVFVACDLTIDTSVVGVDAAVEQVLALLHR